MAKKQTNPLSITYELIGHKELSEALKQAKKASDDLEIAIKKVNIASNKIKLKETKK